MGKGWATLVACTVEYATLPHRKGETLTAITQRILTFTALAPASQWFVYEVPLSAMDVREYWQLMESVDRPNVKLAWPADASESPAVVVPTLNLRIGLLRVTRLDDRAKEFVQRLAGIGSAAFVVIDPPAGENRLAEAQTIATALHAIVAPPKPVKGKAAPVKK